MDACIYQYEEEISLSISKHAYERMKERNGWSKKAADRMLEKVYFGGIRPDKVKGYLKGWINRKADMYEDDREFVLYGEKLYIFNEGTMLTVLPVPTRSYLINNAV